MRHVVVALLGAWLLIFPAQAETRWKLVRSYPHDPGAFTEGLFYHDGALYESTGLEGELRFGRSISRAARRWPTGSFPAPISERASSTGRTG